MKYIVTGGAGFIGSHIVEELVNRGEKVTVIDNLSFGKLKNLERVKDKITFIKGDIRDFDLLVKEFKDTDFILHQAALRCVPASFNNPEDYHDVNVNGALALLKAAKICGVKKVVLASSSSVYGDCTIFPEHEEFMPNPKSPYAKSKLEAERLFEEYSKKGIKTVILRYFNVYGPRQDPLSNYAPIIPKFITQILKDEEPVIYGDGMQSRDFTYVKDIVSANIKACETDITGEIINIGAGKKNTVNQVVEKINFILGKSIRPKYEEERLGDVKHTLADISKQKKLLMLEPKYDLDMGLKETIAWFKNAEN